MKSLHSYYNRHDASKCYDRTMFLSGRGLQSAELNEIQDTMLEKLRGVGDALFNDGNVVDGAAISVDADTGAVRIASGTCLFTRCRARSGGCIACDSNGSAGAYWDILCRNDRDGTGRPAFTRSSGGNA